MDVFLQRLWNPRSDPWKLVSLPKNHGLFRIKKKLHFSEFLPFSCMPPNGMLREMN